jgi:Acetyltransferase (GNAT) domain
MNARPSSRSSTPPPRRTAVSSRPIAGMSRTCRASSSIVRSPPESPSGVTRPLLGVMGIQQMPGVELIRHAYVLPGSQGHGIGSALLKHLRNLSSQPMLVGTWAAADRAIQFYRQHGFELVSTERKTRLLKTHWTIPDRQIATSVVLANPARRRGSISNFCSGAAAGRSGPRCLQISGGGSGAARRWARRTV